MVSPQLALHRPFYACCGYAIGYWHMRTRHIAAVTASVFISFVGATPVFANVINQSSDPAYAQQFYFSCQPYGYAAFEEGKHYLPQDGQCTYSVPAMLSGNVQLLLMKGVPGVGASIVGGDVENNGGTLETQYPNVFGTPATDDNFFAAVYDRSLDQSATPLLDYLSGATSTPPQGAVLGQNYYLLRWKWGVKLPSEYAPVIVVPDVLNTWQTDGGLAVDPLFHLYQNLIDTFTANGHVDGQTLFTFPYDWRQSVEDAAAALGSEIQLVKAACDCNKVNLVGHGLGGLVALQYLSSVGAVSDVGALALLGVPQAGVPASYLAWEGGQIHLGQELQSGVAQVLLNQEAANAGWPGAYQYIQNSVPSFHDLLPTYSYLDGKTYPVGYPANAFLENLISNLPLNFAYGYFYLGGAQLITAVGGGQGTAGSFAITASTQPPLWNDGEPTATHIVPGDGMVPDDSSLYAFGPDYSYTVEHGAIPSSAAGDIVAAFTGTDPAFVVQNSYPTSCVLFVSTTPTTDLLLTNPNTLRLGRDSTAGVTYSEIPNSLYSGHDQTTEYTAVVNPVDGAYTLAVQGTQNGTFTINATEVCNGATTATSTTGSTAPGTVAGYNLTIDSITQTIGLAPVVIEPPPPPAPHITFDDFLPPITAAGHQIDANTSVFKAGSTVPVKFNLVDENGNSVEGAASIAWIVPFTVGALNTSAVATTTDAAALPSSGNYYEWSGDHYQYNWKTSKTDKGYWYELVVILSDGTYKHTFIGLK